ncbi:hypothetical protein WR25_08517 [Diploscapter pachys]|uniref:C2 domain-containing protein n=1 Tax=Diploscapter pachys TaxID=2018661 RepID=A0A2A2LFC8_9BILA|nr:hypothetical protein WR25_08517 [Diploscapter pachys]
MNGTSHGKPYKIWIGGDFTTAPPWMDRTFLSTRSTPCTSPAVPSTSDSCEQLIAEENRLSTSSNRNSLFLFSDDLSNNDLDEMDDRSVLHYELGFYDKNDESCFRGTLTFALRYDFIHRVLMLHVLRANQLPVEKSKDECKKLENSTQEIEKQKTVDPYVKMYLLPERKYHCKTRICKKTLDPEFNEMFSFDVSFNNLPRRMLLFTIYDYDRFTRHGLIGNVIMRDLFDKSDLLNWTEYTMQIVASQKTDFGDLQLRIHYSMGEQKLSIIVEKAYNLRPMDITGASDPYVKISQIYRGKRVKMRKTSIKRANLNPDYHETLDFEMPFTQVDETNMLIEVMDWDRIGKDDLLGCCILGRDSPMMTGREQWDKCFTNAADQNENVRQSSVMMWHSILSDVPDNYKDIPKAKK